MISAKYHHSLQIANYPVHTSRAFRDSYRFLKSQFDVSVLTLNWLDIEQNAMSKLFLIKQESE